MKIDYYVDTRQVSVDATPQEISQLAPAALENALTSIVEIVGRWYAGTWDGLRNEQTSKPVGCLDGSKGDHFKVSPLNNWKPKSGERFYVMVSGHARSTGRNVKERSDPVEVVWK